MRKMEQKDANDEQLVKKKVKNIELDVHSSEAAIVVKYELEAAVHDSESKQVASQSKHFQKIVQLKDLNEGVDASALARHIIKVCPIIPEYRTDELEQVIYYLQKRETCKGDDAGLVSETLDTSPISRASMSCIENYIEMLYDEISEKTKAANLFLQLSQNYANLQKLIENETLMGALMRVLRDDWKKSFELATSIASTFYNLSFYNNFHAVLAHHKIGALSMQIVDYELKRWEAWKVEARNGDERTARRLTLAIRKQQQLITICLNLLLNLAEDIKVEMKMVNRRIVSLLAKCIQDREALPSLLLCATNFLLKLSIYEENKDDMINGHVVESISALFPIENGTLRHSAVRLLFNLSFIASLRDHMVAAGLVSHIAPLIAEDDSALKLLYQLSINDDAKAMITYTDAIQLLMHKLLTNSASEIVKAILINIAIEKRNAQLLCGTDGQGLDLLIEAALDQRDQLLLKIVRNIAMHNGPTQAMFSKWVIRLLEIVIDKNDTERLDSFALECLGIANQLNNVNWASVAEQISLISWIQNNLKGQLMAHSHTDQLLQIVILCGTMARQLEGARLIVPLTDQLVELLSAQQEDDEIVVQVVYVFYAIITHEELSESVMGGSAQIGAYLIDLMHDKNAPIRAICDRALSIIAERSEEWAQKMDIERFRWHNAQWLEMVAEDNGVVSADSVISGSPDIYGEVFGAEDILNDTSPDASFARVDTDF